jgi:hypothetical protein
MVVRLAAALVVITVRRRWVRVLALALSAALSLRAAGLRVMVRLRTGCRRAMVRWPRESLTDFGLAPARVMPVGRWPTKLSPKGSSMVTAVSLGAWRPSVIRKRREGWPLWSPATL